jgi:hypothetical protein
MGDFFSDILDPGGFMFGPDEPDPLSITVETPAQTETEKQLIELQMQILQEQIAGPSPEEQALLDKQKEYYDQLIADETLSPEEQAEFERERDLQLEALEETFAIESGRHGATQLADLVHRGILESTTGVEQIALTQEQFTQLLGEEKTNIMEASELAKSDMEAAKREMAGAGYSLTSAMTQTQTLTALEAASGLQNYFMGRGGLEAQSALTNAILNQTREQAAYQGRMDKWKLGTGVGLGMMQMQWGS